MLDDTVSQTSYGASFEPSTWTVSRSSRLGRVTHEELK